jgi:hypothetical protein
VFDASSAATKSSRPDISGIPGPIWVRRYYQWRLGAALSGRGAEPPEIVAEPRRQHAFGHDADAFDVGSFMALLKRESMADAATVNFRLAERRPVSVRLTQPAQIVSAAPKPARRRSVPINDLLRLDGADFVRNAYVAILAREADRGGLANYLRKLDGGRAAKIEVLRSLVGSKEGRRRGTRVPGLTFWAVYYRVRGRPLSELPRRAVRRLLLALRSAPADSR